MTNVNEQARKLRNPVDLDRRIKQLEEAREILTNAAVFPAPGAELSADSRQEALERIDTQVAELRHEFEYTMRHVLTKAVHLLATRLGIDLEGGTDHDEPAEAESTI